MLLADSAGAAAGLPPRNLCTLEAVDPDHVRPRPLGADRVAEAALEARLWLSDRAQMAAFVDAGLAERRSDLRAAGQPLSPRKETLVSPAIGLRVAWPLGPLRLDLALDTREACELPLYTRNADGVALLGFARYDPYNWDGAGGWTSFRRRLRLWLGVGQPF